MILANFFYALIHLNSTGSICSLSAEEVQNHFEESLSVRIVECVHFQQRE